MSVLTAVAVLVVEGSADGRTVPSRTVIRTSGRLAAVTLDGPRLAYSEDRLAPKCSRVVVVNLSTHERTVASTARKWPACEGTRQLALAGTRIAWIVEGQSNSEQWEYLQASTLPHPGEQRLASAVMYFNPFPATGTQVGNLVGGGRLLVVNRWRVNKHGGPANTLLYAVGPKGLRRILGGPQPILAQAVDGDRIAVERGGLRDRRERLEIYDFHGRRQVEIAVGRVDGEYRGDTVALQGRHLLFLNGKRRLLVYNSHTGVLLHSWPVPNRATNLDAYGGVAVYAQATPYADTPFTVHVLRLASGKDVVLDRGWFQCLRNLELDASGLAYVKDKRTIVYVPLKHVLAAVS